MKINSLRFIGYAFSLLFAVSTRADRGGFTLGKKVDIEETAQNAILVWNGTVQKTILTTQLSANEEVEVVEIMPFPNRPIIEKSDFNILKKLKDFIDQEYEKEKHNSRGLGKGNTEGSKPGSIQFYERKIIGQNDLTVLRINSLNEIQSSINKYLASIGANGVRVDSNLVQVIRQYVKERISWFVLDRIRVGTDPILNEAISYTFNSNYGFYPLKISNTKSGITSINLLILTPNFSIESRGDSWEKIEEMFAPNVEFGFLSQLSKTEFSSLKDAEDIIFTIWHITDDIKKFNRDVIFNSRDLYRRDGKKVGTKPFYNEQEFEAKLRKKDEEHEAKYRKVEREFGAKQRQIEEEFDAKRRKKEEKNRTDWPKLEREFEAKLRKLDEENEAKLRRLEEENEAKRSQIYEEIQAER